MYKTCTSAAIEEQLFRFSMCMQDVVTNLLEVDLASNKAAVANFEVPFDLPFNQVFCESMLLPWDSVCTGPAFAACAGEESFKDSLCDGYPGPINCTTKAASFPIDDSVSQFSVIVTGAPVATTK